MEIRGVSREQLEAALAATNRVFSDNVAWKRCESHKTRHGGEWFTTTLTVKDSRAPGATRSLPYHSWAIKPNPAVKPRRMAACCWHVFATFLNSLPEGAVVKGTHGTWSPGDELWDTRHGVGKGYLLWEHERCVCPHQHFTGTGFLQKRLEGSTTVQQGTKAALDKKPKL